MFSKVQQKERRLNIAGKVFRGITMNAPFLMVTMNSGQHLKHQEHQGQRFARQIKMGYPAPLSKQKKTKDKH
ncbi:MAG: hypothetical protein A2460_01065 [Omnitrophica WOR_2 bacterium RIFOXYC2_FULL_43_9]|nr:MAG: hypothetical protein A2460_01065 [Omnitrophica WOR_2 bacterium RIFOXYC2_FULL_43_9]